MHFVERVDTLLNQHKITRNSLVKEIGISKNSFVNWEKGSSPSAETVSKIADYLGVSTDYLLGRTDSPNGTAEVQILGYVDSNNKAHAFEDLTGEELQKLIDYADMIRKARNK